MVLWLLAGDRRVEPVLPRLSSTRGMVLVSVVSIWEAAIKAALGKLRAPDDLPAQIRAFAFEELPIQTQHAWAVRDLPAVHHDPFDRLLAAQALCEDAAIVSADGVFDDYGVRRVWETV